MNKKNEINEDKKEIVSNIYIYIYMVDSIGRMENVENVHAYINIRIISDTQFNGDYIFWCANNHLSAFRSC